MENETRVKLVQKACLEIYDKLQPEYRRLNALGDDAIVVVERNKVINYCIRANEIIEKVTTKNVTHYEKVVAKLQEEISEKYGIMLTPLATVIDNSLITEPVKEEETKVEEKDNTGAFVAVGLGCATLGVLGTLAYMGNKSNVPVQASVIDTTRTTTVEETENNIRVVTSENEDARSNGENATIIIADNTAATEEEQAIDEVVSDTLVLGEYGTFFDASNEEQVMARAQFIYDNYYAPYMHKLSQSEREFVTVERIANTIRVMNGHCPLDENGYMTLDANTVDTYGQAFIELTANIPSSDVMGTVELVPAYLFAEDGSDLQVFIKSYDEVYGRIAEGRNNRDSAEYRAAGKIMGAKYYNEWFLQGMRGYILYNNATDEISYTNDNVTYSEELGRLVYYNPDTLVVDTNIEVYQSRNPHNFDATYRYFAYQATMARYGSYLKEAEFNQMATICVPVCVDYSSKEMDELSLPEIYTAINDGVWNDIIARSAGMEVPTEPMLVGFWEALDAQLNFEYNHTNTLKLN